MLPRPLMIALAVLISLVWAVNVIVGFIDPARHDPTLNAIFALVVGAVFALGRKESRAVKDARRRIAHAIAGEDDDEPEDQQ
ncbi:hypothetical protein ACWEVP_31650 [Amycolatopsis sp. NPDC003865]